MFTSQCNTGVSESTFKTPDTIKNASERQASQHRTWIFGVGAWGWRIGDGLVWKIQARRIGRR
ncbi:hypothetical protein MESS2_580020 [Mesorhizobium metallidurans STM 2683]|uniref:Uncharacterized protein n=1 Tax=Mesorhizobium metallidurans STM 2683 TaxID=1297569 RepID=M5ET86_9HYPH|nr:hypothetical protein MESS2_580020 [Mesorhizobium metallidurans STM 2683]